MITYFRCKNCGHTWKPGESPDKPCPNVSPMIASFSPNAEYRKGFRDHEPTGGAPPPKPVPLP